MYLINEIAISYEYGVMVAPCSWAGDKKIAIGYLHIVTFVS